MMSMFRKFSQLSKKRVCGVLFTICLISPFFVVSASADTVDFVGTAEAGLLFAPVFSDSTENYYTAFPNFDLPVYNDQHNKVLWQMPEINKPLDYLAVSLSKFKVSAPSDSLFYGNVNFYLSFYCATANESVTWQRYAPNIDTFEIEVFDSRGAKLDFSREASYFTPALSDYPSNSVGVTYQFSVEVPQESPFISIDMNAGSYSLFKAFGVEFRTDIFFIVPSATLLLEKTSEEVKAIEEVADLIVQQNNVSVQYYADVISKVDSLYTEIGNLSTLQEQAIEQFDDWNVVSSVPGSVQNKVDKADQVIADINSLVKPDPDLLVPSVDVNTDDISSIFAPFFENALILQLCTMVLGFAFVSYVLFGKKG